MVTKRPAVYTRRMIRVLVILRFIPAAWTIRFFIETDKYVMHMGKVPCQEPFVVDSSSKWQFVNNETQIEKSAGFSGDELFTIEQLSEDSLTLHHGIIGIGSIQYTITYKNLR